uniref:B-cell receptor CD22 n=1 Tax=Geotrypetes seraphini TaxID=260995 RepID=A0A6P8SVL9_GEOSA|nr:B-cell receptor CD22 [Geotrypetes seraphini]
MVYHTTSGENTSYSNRVTYLGDQQNNCSMLIEDLRKEDSGHYGVRLIANTRSINKPDVKWMSKPFLSLNITDSPPDPQIYVSKDITENVQTTIICSVDYYCPSYPLNLSWVENMGGTNSLEVKKYPSGLRTENTLTFTPSWKDHKKTLSCRLFTLKDRRETSASETLNVKFAPRNVQIYIGKEGNYTNSSMTMKEGEEIVLRCAAESSNPVVSKYEWQKNNRFLKSDMTLEIQNASFEKSGSYTCQAFNGVRSTSTTSKPLIINIQYAPKETRIQRTRELVKENDSLTLTCESQSNPPVTSYSWYKDHDIYSNYRGKEIHFHKLSDTDSGSYHCTVSNELGNGTSSDVTVDVNYAPRSVEVLLTSPGKKIKEGERITLMCSYNSSNPAVSEYKWWQKKDENISCVAKTQKLHFESITQQNSSEYRCEASNRVGNLSSTFITINVLFAPKEVKIEVLNNHVIKEGDYVKLRCLVKASIPEVTEYTWYKGGSSYPQSHGYELIFETIQSTDTGRYQCTAQNEIGSTKSTVVLVDVHYAPKNVRVTIIPAPNLIVEHSDIMLVCDADANPNVSGYGWYREKQRLGESKRMLYLNQMNEDLAGEYQCEAFNNVSKSLSEAVIISFSYSSTTIIRFAGLGIGLFFCLILLALFTLRFMQWKKQQQQKMPTIIQEDEKNDSFFVVNKKHGRDETTDGRARHNQASFHSVSREEVNYASLQFSPSYAEEELGISRISANKRSINLQVQEASAIYSVVQKCRRSLQNADYENCGETNNALSETEKEEDIHYASIVNLKCLQKIKQNDWASDSDSDDTVVQYATLRH